MLDDKAGWSCSCLVLLLLIEECLVSYYDSWLYVIQNILTFGGYAMTALTANAETIELKIYMLPFQLKPRLSFVYIFVTVVMVDILLHYVR